MSDILHIHWDAPIARIEPAWADDEGAKQAAAEYQAVLDAVREQREPFVIVSANELQALRRVAKAAEELGDLADQQNDGFLHISEVTCLIDEVKAWKEATHDTAD